MAPRGLSFSRLIGLDRSGPPPDQVRAGAPLRPWTLPNAIGYVRLALIPVFVLLALASRAGHSLSAEVVFAGVGWADYLDGFTARLTGQYSRLGAMLDPVIDRLLVVAGMAVAWDFRLLPRWALALVIARELTILVISRYGLRRGVEIRINWAGRIGVAPVMGAPFFAMTGPHWLAVTLLYVGMALGLLALGLYVRRGIRQLREGSSSD